MIKKVFCLLVLCSSLSSAFAQSAKTRWVDSVFSKLTITEKIGQLFLVPVSSTSEQAALTKIENDLKSHRIGGIILTQGSPVRLARMTNKFQELAGVPLFVGINAPWGLGSSLDSAISFPKTLQQGAIHNDTMIYRLGRVIGKQMKTIGANINFAPGAEVSNTLQVPFNSAHSFGEDKVNVANKSVAFMRGLQDEGVMACAKYFPVKGLTILDIQNDFPVLQPSIDSVQVYPYRQLFANGLKGIIPAGTQFPLFYQNMNLIKKNRFNSVALTSLFTGDWLKKEMKFEGLAFVDMENVKVMSSRIRPGDTEMFAFQAGNDILMNSVDVNPAIRKIRRLIRKEPQYEAQLDNTVKKILAAKFDAGLWQKQKVNTDNLVRRLNAPETELFSQKVYNATVTVIGNKQGTLPVMTLEDKRFAYITCDATAENKVIHDYLNKYTHVSYHSIDEQTDLKALSDTLRRHDVIVVGVFPKSTQSTVDTLKQLLLPLTAEREIIMCDFGSELFLRASDEFPTVITAYADLPATWKAVPQIIFGALKADGKLPFTASDRAIAGTGLKTKALHRLVYSIPEDAEMNSRVLEKIDTIAREAIRIGATPGCQVFVARHGKVIYQKSFGHLTYDKKTPVTDETIYDLASVTKVSATLQTAMFMQERGLVNLYKKVSYYLPELRKTNKKDITLVDMLTHQSGLVPFIPLWPQTVKDTTFLPEYYSRTKSVQYPLQVAPNLYASPAIRDSVWVWIVRSKMGDKPVRTPYPYKYSDLGFLILQHLAEKMLNQPMEDFLQQNLYEPLGAYTTGFTPLERFPQQIIAPTEDDKIFRKTAVAGTVHDERAAMMGGVAGHAGLFSNANDLGKLGQMLLQEGQYGGLQYYKPETVRLFTARQFETSRRGLGWDKPLQSDMTSPTSLLASPRTFGHTGFTGTCIWIDPEFDLVYIFLSNRVYPDRNNKLSNANIRSRIQDVIYQSIFKYNQYEDQEVSIPVAIN